MYNNFIKTYCNKFDLEVKKIHNSDQNVILDNDNFVGSFKQGSKYVSFCNKMYKKSDLILFILENTKAH